MWKNISDAAFFPSYKSSSRGQGTVKIDVESLVFLQPLKMQQNTGKKEDLSRAWSWKCSNDQCFCLHQRTMSEMNWPKGLVHEKKKENQLLPQLSHSKLNNLRSFSKDNTILKKSTDPDVKVEAIQRSFLWNSCTIFGETAFWSLNLAHLNLSSHFHIDNSAKSTRVYSVAYAQTTFTQCSLNRWVDVRVVSYLTLDWSLQHCTSGGVGGWGGVWGRLFSTGPAWSDNSALLIYICSGWQAQGEIEVQHKRVIFLLSVAVMQERRYYANSSFSVVQIYLQRMRKSAIIIQIWHRGRGGRPAAPL